MLKRSSKLSAETPAVRLTAANGVDDRDLRETKSGEDDVCLRPGEEKIIEVFVQFAHAVGMPRSLAEIYGLLFATARPLAFQEIVDRLGISKGSASQGLKFLRAMGAVTPIEIPGDRREFFQPVVELRKLVAGFVRERLEPELAAWGDCAAGLTVADFGDRSRDSDDAEVLADRVRKFRKWQARANAILPKVSRLLG